MSSTSSSLRGILVAFPDAIVEIVFGYGECVDCVIEYADTEGWRISQMCWCESLVEKWYRVRYQGDEDDQLLGKISLTPHR
jgi:hypothetical protein